MWKDLLLFPVVFICSVIIVSLSVLGLFSIDSFLSFILRSSVCMYIHNTKIFQQKNCKKKMVYFKTNSRHVCLCVCMRVRMAAAALTQFSDFFFPWISGGGNKNDNFKKKKKFFSTEEEKNSAFFFYWDTRGARGELFEKKKRPTYTKSNSEIPSLERNL